jgi:hypothetical protein
MAHCLTKNVLIGDTPPDDELKPLLNLRYKGKKRVNEALIRTFTQLSAPESGWYLQLLNLLLRCQCFFAEESALVRKLQELCEVELDLNFFLTVTTAFPQKRKFVLDEADRYHEKFEPSKAPEDPEVPVQNRPMLSKLKAYFRMHALLTINNAYGQAMDIYLGLRQTNQKNMETAFSEMVLLLRETFIRFAQERQRGQDDTDCDPPTPKKL